MHSFTVSNSVPPAPIDGAHAAIARRCLQLRLSHDPSQTVQLARKFIMKRAPKAHSRIAAPFFRRARLVGTSLLIGMLVAGVGCSSASPGGSGPMGSTGATGSGAASATGGGAGPTGSGGGSQTGSGGGDLYTVPASPPASVLVATPRVARLSRQQWANAVQDLLKLSDISDIASNVSGDALIGFDDEAESLFVTEQLRS